MSMMLLAFQFRVTTRAVFAYASHKRTVQNAAMKERRDHKTWVIWPGQGWAECSISETGICYRYDCDPVAWSLEPRS